MINRLVCLDALCIFSQGVARIHVAVIHREIAARDIYQYAVSFFKQVAGCAEVDPVFYNVAGRNRLRLEYGNTVPRPDHALGHRIGPAVRIRSSSLQTKSVSTADVEANRCAPIGPVISVSAPNSGVA